MYYVGWVFRPSYSNIGGHYVPCGRQDIMRTYTRFRTPGAIYFFTVVTYRREPILTTSIAMNCLRQAFRRVRHERPFETLAIVVLPDHLHAIWKMPSNDDDFSTRWRLIKTYFTRSFIEADQLNWEPTFSQQRRRERPIWQRRFWERLVRVEELEKCFDYIHFNPIKHGLVSRVQDYPWSSFRSHVRSGMYDIDWGGDSRVEDAHPFGE